MKTTKSLDLSSFEAHDNKVGSGDTDNSGGSSSIRLDTLREKLTKSKNQDSISGQLAKLGKNNAIEEPKFLTFKVREAFNHLKLAFIKVLILQHFDLKCHFYFKTNASSYAIRKILS